MFVVGKVKVCIKVVLFRGIQQNARPARLARMLRGRGHCVQLLAIVRMRIRQKHRTRRQKIQFLVGKKKASSKTVSLDIRRITAWTKVNF